MGTGAEAAERMRDQAPRNVLFLVGRDNFKKSQSLMRLLMERLEVPGTEFIMEDPGENWILSLQRMGKGIRWFPDLMGPWNRKALKLVYGLFHWRYFTRIPRKDFDLASRCRHLKRRIEAHGKGKRIYVLGLSSGARAASLIADDLPIRHLICIGYPFRNPERGEEPERYLHLERLGTATLIVQGARDSYGGSEVAQEYPLSPRIELLMVEADHGYAMDERDWGKVIARIKGILA